MEYTFYRVYKNTRHIGSPSQQLQLPEQGARYH
jgi:hypothetical protein